MYCITNKKIKQQDATYYISKTLKVIGPHIFEDNFMTLKAKSE